MWPTSTIKISSSEVKPVKYLIHSDDGSEFLCHYGVKGMKWGVRREQKRQSKLRLRQARAAARGDMAADKLDKLTAKLERKLSKQRFDLGDTVALTQKGMALLQQIGMNNRAAAMTRSTASSLREGLSDAEIAKGARQQRRIETGKAVVNAVLTYGMPIAIGAFSASSVVSGLNVRR